MYHHGPYIIFIMSYYPDILNELIMAPTVSVLAMTETSNHCLMTYFLSAQKETSLNLGLIFAFCSYTTKNCKI